MFAAWVADQELESIKRRTRDGLERARQQGKVLGPPRKVGPGQSATFSLYRWRLLSRYGCVSSV